MERRTLVRSLLAAAFGVPLLVEGGTVLGMFSHSLGDERDDGGTATETTGVGVGDELLAATAATEDITQAVVRMRDGYWQFDLSVEVTNPGDERYRLVVGTVEATNGKRVDGGFRVEVPPGESKTASGTWRLPEGQRPASVEVEAYEGSDPVASETVEFRDVAVRS
ncbi:MAG: hypothetical protein ABEJ06_01700 [Haloarculaceae archaeon]